MCGPRVADEWQETLFFSVFLAVSFGVVPHVHEVKELMLDRGPLPRT